MSVVSYVLQMREKFEKMAEVVQHNSLILRLDRRHGMTEQQNSIN